MNYSQAKDIAVSLCYQLQPFCDKINIAGSLRRQKPQVKDIEIICSPKYEEIDMQTDMFSTEKAVVISSGFITTSLSFGTLIKGDPRGKYMQMSLPEGINLDLFIPDSFDYYRQYAIRTGSADYSFKVIAAGWKKIGWCGSDVGLRRMYDCIESKGSDGKSKWKCINPMAEEPPVWESEQHFFDWIGIKMIHPKDRSI